MRWQTKIHKHHTIFRGLISCLLLIMITCLTTTRLNAGDKSSPINEEWIVVIDAGHGGKDPGTVGRRTREKDLTLAIALKTGKYIQERIPGVKVIYTRTDDTFIEIYKRAEIANRAKADLFISIHINGLSDRRVRGAETYAMGIHMDEGNLQVAMKENAVITLEDDYTTRYQGYDPNSSESFIAFSLQQNLYLEQSLNFASYIQKQFSERIGLRDRGVKQAGFIVLWQTTMPSVLVEAGFSSNEEEEKLLMSAEGQDYIASAIFRAFRDYKESIDKKSDFSTINNGVIFANNTNNIDFRVQIATSGTKTDPDPGNFKGLESISELVSGKYYKYTAGHFPTYEEAASYRKSIVNIYPDAFVIAVRNNEIIPLQEAIDESRKELK